MALAGLRDACELSSLRASESDARRAGKAGAGLDHAMVLCICILLVYTWVCHGTRHTGHVAQLIQLAQFEGMQASGRSQKPNPECKALPLGFRVLSSVLRADEVSQSRYHLS